MKRLVLVDGGGNGAADDSVLVEPRPVSLRVTPAGLVVSYSLASDSAAKVALTHKDKE